MRGSLRIKHGNHKAEAKTFYKYKEKTSPMSGAHSPERNVQNDSAKSSFTTSVPQGGLVGSLFEREEFLRDGLIADDGLEEHSRCI